MNKILLIGVLVSTLFLSGCNAAMMSAMGGAGGGAILGQAIGNNTEATLIGAAAGGLLGYIGGNEYDKFNRNYRVVPRQQQVYDTRGSYQQPVQYRQARPQQQYRQPQQWQPGW